MTGSKDLLTVSEVSRRSGYAPSALRYYESEGLVRALRTSGGRRRYERGELRRLAFVRAARNVGLSLEEIREALDGLPQGRTPNKEDWARISRAWRGRLDEQIDALVAFRDGLQSCIGCGCLTLRSCWLNNPGDAAAAQGPGARMLPGTLRRGRGGGHEGGRAAGQGPERHPVQRPRQRDGGPAGDTGFDPCRQDCPDDLRD